MYDATDVKLRRKSHVKVISQRVNIFLTNLLFFSKHEFLHRPVIKVPF